MSELKRFAWFKQRRISPYRITGFLWSLFRALLLAGISFVLVFPILFMLSDAFKPVGQNYDPSVIWIPKSFTFENVTDALKVMDIWKTLGNTFAVSITSALLQVVSCLLIGYGFARFNFKGRNVLFILVLLTIIVPPQTISSSLYFQYKYFDLFGLLTVFKWLTGAGGSINLVGSNWVFYIPSLLGMGLRSGLYIFIFRQFFRGMPKELEDAAYIDGCGPYASFMRIMLPNAGGAILTVLLFSIVWQWNDFYTPAMFLNNKYTIATALAAFQQNLSSLSNVGGLNTDPYVVSTRIQAACLVSIAPLVILYIFTQRYFTESIERTGINS
ncbi:multiple sugar transport system permease protein [Paenibacillus taihuensis]|uniref:Multiple sugar transport system permease protein n=1 Tax=Paenibacillus taihuensis TaxID=1156355 RepID=A0A3D9Q3U7_9BACL|nr:carbohydrate ABC transporter permease [Paenibacillus taihuensis]REE56446.1 multiple sugar transport system permease protein [Paenibacillus taihuensis]